MFNQQRKVDAVVIMSGKVVVHPGELGESRVMNYFVFHGN